MKVINLYLFKSAKELNQEAIANGCNIFKLPFTQDEERNRCLYSRMEVEFSGDTYCTQLLHSIETYQYCRDKEYFEEMTLRELEHMVVNKISSALRESINEYNSLSGINRIT